MSTTIFVAAHQETIALRAINAFFVGGLVLDIMAATLAYLTTRWLYRLTEKEKDFLEEAFSRRNADGNKRRQRRGVNDLVYYTWLGMSLFVPMPLLILGVLCMMGGLYTYVWTQHSTVVAALVTLAGAATLPFLAGDFYIGREPERRKQIILRLSEMQGDW